jgi:hypothetical protein
MKILIALLSITLARAEDANKFWPSETFKHVVAYCYDFSKDSRGSAITFPDGSLHKGVIRATTVRLEELQVSKLRSLISTDSDTEHRNVDCYDPHHAFVFYDAEWKVIASVDVCFLCDDYQARPMGISKSIDLAALETFTRNLGLPMLEESSEYSALYQQEHPVRATPKPEKIPSATNDDDPFADDDDE